MYVVQAAFPDQTSANTAAAELGAAGADSVTVTAIDNQEDFGEDDAYCVRGNISDGKAETCDLPFGFVPVRWTLV